MFLSTELKILFDVYTVQPSCLKHNLYPDPIFYYTRCITLKCITNLRGPSPHHYACGKCWSLRRNVAAVTSWWQHCVWFDWLEIWTSNLPLERRTHYRSTIWLIHKLYQSAKIILLVFVLCYIILLLDTVSARIQISLQKYYFTLKTMTVNFGKSVEAGNTLPVRQR